MPSEQTPDEGDGSERMQLLLRWLELEAVCDRALARQFVEARHGAPGPTPALSLEIEGLLAAAEQAKAAYRASKK